MTKTFKITLLFLLSALLFFAVRSAFASEVALAAAEPTAMSLKELITHAAFAIVSAFLLFVTNYAKHLIAQHDRNKSHERGVAVTKDALYSALDRTKTCIDEILIDADARKVVFEEWEKVAKGRLDNLYGFKKSNLSAWVQDQQIIIYQQLINRTV